VTFNKYFQDELTYLTDLGKEFAEANPKLAPFLGERGNDPDVERLLEGFAFLTGRLRERLDDEFSELTHGLMSLLWPHYLRALPSMAIVQFTPQAGLAECKRVPRGAELDSVPVDGTRCRFRTCYDLDLAPLSLSTVSVERTSGGSRATLGFRLDPRAQIAVLGLQSLRLFLHGEDYITTNFFLWLFRYLDGVTVTAEPARAGGFRLPAACIRSVGFAEEEAVIPYPANAFSGYRLLQEYFALPEKYLFFEVAGLEPLAALDDIEGFSLTFEFSRPLAEQIRLEQRHFALHCTPVVNLFGFDAKPIRLDHELTEYRLLPESTQPDHHRIFAVEEVAGWVPGVAARRLYEPFESFRHALVETGADDALYYQVRRRPAVVGDGVDYYLAFVDASQGVGEPRAETVSVELVCSNGDLPHELKVGDICQATATSPEFAEFRNITQPTMAVPPPLSGRLYWKLISNLSLNYVSLVSPEALRELLAVYDFHALRDRQAERRAKLRMEGIEDVRSEPAHRLFGDLPVRGRRITMQLREGNFGTEGDMYLFASVLNEFFALYASVNSYTELVVHATESREIYRWAPKSGRQPIV
jgi:type VI secretion system protein ImpG